MKKNISINLQGIIFHIEEDGYDVLSRYLTEVKAHFSGYRGHEEIVGDIEARIAELFMARTSSSKQVITLLDVNAVVAKMGRVSDFQSADEAEEEEEALAGGAAAYSSYTANGTAEPGPRAQATGEPAPARRLYRDMTNRKIAGVAAGLAGYFAVNPLWVRLGFLVLLFMRPLFRSIFHFDNGDVFHDSDFNFEGFNLGGFALIAYVVLWIALPKRYDTVSVEEDPTFKKLYRDTDTGKVGGVSAGLAAYFRTDVVLIRILFIVFVFAGGFGIPLYIALWILLPEAKTVGDKMRMRGDAVTVSSLTNRLNDFANEVSTTATRPVGTFLEELFRNLKPLFSFLGTAIRWAVAAILILIGGSWLFAAAVLLGVGLGIVPESQELVQTGNLPVTLLAGELPGWGLAAGFLVLAVPALALLLLGIRLLLKRSAVSRTLGLVLFGLWLLGVFGTAFVTANYVRSVREDGLTTRERELRNLTASTIYLDVQEVDGNGFNRVRDVTLSAADSGRFAGLTEAIAAQGPTAAAANQFAAHSIEYPVQQLNDSTVVLGDHFRFLPGQPYHWQRLSVTVNLPRNKTIRLSEAAADLLGEDAFLNQRMPDNVAQHTFRLTDGGQLRCQDCTAEEVATDPDDTTETSSDDAITIRSDENGVDMKVGTEKDEDGNFNVSIDPGKAAFPTALSSYGRGRKNFNLSGFEQIEASGTYRVYVRRGDQFRVEAAGNERDLRQLRASTSGGTLRLRSRDNGSFSLFGWRSSQNRRPVLIRVTMPELRELDLSGACKADVAGFQGRDLRVDASGISVASLAVDVPRLAADLSGACRLDLRGRTDELHVEGSGACQVNALPLTTRKASFDLSGSSRGKVRVTQELTTDLSGASRVEYAGNPTEVRNETSGSSKLVRVGE